MCSLDDEWRCFRVTGPGEGHVDEVANNIIEEWAISPDSVLGLGEIGVSSKKIVYEGDEPRGWGRPFALVKRGNPIVECMVRSIEVEAAIPAVQLSCHERIFPLTANGMSSSTQLIS
jgi:hypothetical protein